MPPYLALQTPTHHRMETRCWVPNRGLDFPSAPLNKFAMPSSFAWIIPNAYVSAHRITIGSARTISTLKMGTQLSWRESLTREFIHKSKLASHCAKFERANRQLIGLFWRCSRKGAARLIMWSFANVPLGHSSRGRTHTTTRHMRIFQVSPLFRVVGSLKLSNGTLTSISSLQSNRHPCVWDALRSSNGEIFFSSK